MRSRQTRETWQEVGGGEAREVEVGRVLEEGRRKGTKPQKPHPHLKFHILQRREKEG